MIDISKIDDKNISFNGKTCAAVYKAKVGGDDNGEYVLITEIGGAYKSKLRLEELMVNAKPCRTADIAASELNQFIGNFKKGGNGGDVKTVNYRVPDTNGNIQLTAADIGAATISAIDSYIYKKLRIGSHTSTSGYLVKLRDGTVADGTVVRIVGYSSYGKPINTMFQLVATRVTGKPHTISSAMGYNYGYELKDIRIFTMLTGSTSYSAFLWIPSISGASHMGISVFDSTGGINSGLGNMVSDISLRTSPLADEERLSEIVFTPTSFVANSLP
ncbi:MAG: hypothetical protein LBG19_01135 [Prevotellaceae bacterium]|jgi:hypothetical protein|nr:hypothetical protein [Prevotellaceae bacterium]